MLDGLAARRRGVAPKGLNGFGSQIRSYTLSPQARVKDYRTGVEESDVEAVLDGNLDNFMTGELLRRSKKKHGKVT